MMAVISHLSTDLLSGIFESDILGSFLTKITSNLAFNAGSSMQGKTFLASTAANKVAARYLKANSAPCELWFTKYDWEIDTETESHLDEHRLENTAFHYLLRKV